MRELAAPLGWLTLHLGPWSPLLSPGGYWVETRTLPAPRGPLRARWYEPTRTRPRGVYLVAPGLHPDGPADPRFERFCAALAAAGFLVLAPFLPDSQALLVAPTATADLDAALGYLLEQTRPLGLPRPALFSISFGSLPAIEVAAARGDEVGALVLFGGFASFARAVRFAISGEMPGRGRAFVPSDPLNWPAVFVNVLPFLETSHRDELAAAWRRVVRRTWGRMELKRPGSRWPMAEQEGEALPEGPVRELFYVGCGLRPGGVRRVEEGLRRAGSHFDYTDPLPALARVRAPVAIAHGRADDVIPYTESVALAEAVPAGHKKKLFLTGFYDHTGSALPGPREAAREVAVLGGLLRALAAAPLGVL